MTSKTMQRSTLSMLLFFVMSGLIVSGYCDGRKTKSTGIDENLVPSFKLDDESYIEDDVSVIQLEQNADIQREQNTTETSRNETDTEGTTLPSTTEGNPCTSSPCLHGECQVINSVDYKCKCHEKYIGKNCEYLNPCFGNNVLLCLNGGKCMYKESGNHSYEPYCKCPGFYTGSLCEEIDWCNKEGNSICGEAECVNTKNTYVCRCQDTGKYFDYVSKSCTPEINCLTTNCEDPFSYCSLETGKCTCIQGYKNMNTDGRSVVCYQNYCSYPQHNDCQQTCQLSIERERKYTCGCYNEFSLQEDGKNCTSNYLICKNKDCVQGVCDSRGTCRCNQGYKLDDAGMCTKLDCPEICKGKCHRDYDNRLWCTCEDYEYLDENTGGCKLKDLCKEKAKECLENEECVQENRDAICECKDGYIREQDKCKPLDLCTEKKCWMKNAQCQVRRNQAECICKYPFISDNSGTCILPEMYSGVFSIPKTINPDIRSSLSCDHAKDRIPKVLTEEEKITLALTSLYSDSPPKVFVSKVSTSDSSTETNEVTDYKVQLLFTDKKVSLSRIEERCTNHSNCECFLSPALCMKFPNIKAFTRNSFCSKEFPVCPSNTDCISNGEDSVSCRCKTGYKQRASFPVSIFKSDFTTLIIDNCDDINECEEILHPCGKNARCVNRAGSFHCVCLEGSVRFNDTTNADCVHPCDLEEKPCGGKGECIKTSKGGMYCQCFKGYKGVLCRDADKNLMRAETTIIVLGCVLGAVVVLTALGAALIIFNYRKYLKRRREEQRYVRRE